MEVDKESSANQTTPSVDDFKNAQTPEAESVEFQNGSSNNTDETKEKKTKRTCLICVDAEADVVFKPCGHAVLCKGIETVGPQRYWYMCVCVCLAIISPYLNVNPFAQFMCVLLPNLNWLDQCLLRTLS